MRRSPGRVVLESTLDDADGPSPSSSIVLFTGDRGGGFGSAQLRREDLSPELAAEIGRVFGSAVLADPVKAAAIETVAREFRHQGAKVLSAAVYMGRALLQLRDQIGMQSLLRGMRESRLIFCGWSAGNLSKMMRVGEFVDTGGYALDSLPQNWSTTYELTTLDGAQLAEAHAGHLVRPDVTRSQIQDFKRRVLPSPDGMVDAEGASRDQMQKKLEGLRQRRDRLERQLSTARTAVKEMERRMSALRKADRS